MKKVILSFLVLTTILSSVSALARGNERDDRPIIRISVGENRNADTHQRIQRLESAVRDLQEMVYDLQDDRRDRVITEHVCALKTNFNGTFIGRGGTKLEAEASAVAACRRGGANFCENTKQQCEVTSIQSRRYFIVVF